MEQVEIFQKVLSTGFPGSSNYKVIFGPIFRLKIASQKKFFALVPRSHRQKYFLSVNMKNFKFLETKPELKILQLEVFKMTKRNYLT